MLQELQISSIGESEELVIALCCAHNSNHILKKKMLAVFTSGFAICRLTGINR